LIFVLSCALNRSRIVIGAVSNAQAHRSKNKLNVFSNFEVRVDEVLKGSNLTAGSVINVQRTRGLVKYPNGPKVLFRLIGNGVPAVGARYAFFLKAIDDDYSTLTAYELGTEGEARSRVQGFAGECVSM
jgi:hypothetical protein